TPSFSLLFLCLLFRIREALETLLEATMKKIGIGILTAVVAVSAAACSSTNAGDDRAQTGSTAEQLTGPGGDGIFGSDTLAEAISDLSLQDVRSSFCGTDGSGSAAACTVNTWGQLSNGASSTNPTHAFTKYRRDDASGTTDTFKTILGNNGLACNAFCSDVK